jgi:multidrug efflux pump subunit AcrA (membrane-fusion protein)
VESATVEIEREKARARELEQALGRAEVAEQVAELSLSRTEVRSPMRGRVMRLMVSPGQKRFLNVEDPESATVAVLYDPRSLQVRVDVPLADAAGLEVGQAARIRCSLLPDTVFEGRVTRVTGEADLQRNTLQAKVQLLDPDPRLRPEMLCRVEFLEAGPGAVGTTAAAGTDAGGLLTWVPESALEQGRVWICDVGSRRVQPREVEATPHVRDGYVRVASGVRPGEWVVVSPARLRPDQRVNPRLLEP